MFKVGDKVKVLEEEPAMGLHKGEIYTIRELCNFSTVRLEGLIHKWATYRLTLHQPANFILNKWYPIHQLPTSFEEGTIVQYLRQDIYYHDPISRDTSSPDDLAFRILSFPKKRVEKEIKGFAVLDQENYPLTIRSTFVAAREANADRRNWGFPDNIVPCTIAYTIEE